MFDFKDYNRLQRKNDRKKTLSGWLGMPASGIGARLKSHSVRLSGLRWVGILIIGISLCLEIPLMAQSKPGKTPAKPSSSKATSAPGVSNQTNQGNAGKIVGAMGSSADPASRVAIPGKKGIYLNTGYEFLSPLHPGKDQAVAVQIERSPAGKTDWQTIMRYDAPHDKAQLKSRLAAVDVADFLMADSIINRIWSIINQPKIDELPFYFNSLPVRRAIGSLALDSTALPDIAYHYRLSRLNAQDKSSQPIISTPVTFPRKIDFPPLIFKTRHTNSGIVVLNWMILPGKDKEKPVWPAFFEVWRQDKITDPFHPVSVKRLVYQSKDTLFLELQDSLGLSTRIARYYIVPLDLYESGGNPSDTVWGTVYNRLDIPRPSHIKTESIDSLGSIKLSWQLTDPSLIKSIRIFRSTSFDSGYVKIDEISPKSVHYIDSRVEPMKVYYYTMQPITILDEELPSTAKIHGLAMSSSIPIAPQIRKAEGLSNGVRLEIICLDPMLEGYRVYRSLPNGDSLKLISDLILVKPADVSSRKAQGKTPSKSKNKAIPPATQAVNAEPTGTNQPIDSIRPVVTIFIDSSRDLSGKIQYAYAVRAENTSHILGEFSDTVWVRPLLPTKPLPPLNLQVYPGTGRIGIHWDNMASIDESIAAYAIYRRTISPDKRIPSNSQFSLVSLKPLMAEQNYFQDTTVEEGVTYQYSVESLDKFSGRSGLSQPIIALIPAVLPLPPDNLRLEMPEQGVSLLWDEVRQNNLVSYQLYRYERGQKPVLISTIPISQDSTQSAPLTYLDRTALKGHLYFYYLTTRDHKNRESQPSREISLYR